MINRANNIHGNLHETAVRCIFLDVATWPMYHRHKQAPAWNRHRRDTAELGPVAEEPAWYVFVGVWYLMFLY